MAKDFKIIEKTNRGEIIFDEGLFEFNPKDFTPYQYKKFKTLKGVKKFVKKNNY